MSRKALTELTATHHVILEMLVDGHKMGAIRKAINVSSSTVYAHTSRMARILGVSADDTIPALVNEAFRRGLYKPQPSQRQCSVCLSPAQVFVLWLMAEGKGVSSVSRIISLPTTTTHSVMRQIILKFGVTSRTDAVRAAWSTGILTGEMSPPAREWRCYPSGCGIHSGVPAQRRRLVREPRMV